MLGVLALVAVPGACLVAALPGVYEAHATVIPVGNVLAQASAVSGDSPFQAVTEQVLGRSRLASLIRQFNLYPDIKGNIASAAQAMRKNILIAPARDAHSDLQPFAFSVSFRGGDPDRVAQVTNRLAHSYEIISKSIQAEEFSSASEILKERLGLLSNKLDEQQKLIDGYRIKHQGEMPDQQDLNLVAMQRVDARLRENSARQLQLMDSRSQLLQRMDASEDTGLPQLEQRLADLKLRYTDKYPAVIDLEQRIARLKAVRSGDSRVAAVRSPIERQLADLDRSLDKLRRQERRLRSQLAVYQRRLDGAPIAGQGLKALTQGYAETSDLYASLLKRYEQVRIAHATASGSGPRYQVLEAAMVPTAPVGPARLRLFILVFVLGFGFAGVAAMVVEQADTSFHSVDEVHEFTNLPVLAAVPVISTPADIKKRRIRGLAVIIGFVVCVGFLGSGAVLYAQANHTLAQRLTHNVSSPAE